MAPHQPLFARDTGWGDSARAAVLAASPTLNTVQDRVYGAVVSKRRGLALSLIANAVLLALLVFKSTPPPPLRSNEPCLAPLIWPEATLQQEAGEKEAGAATAAVAAAAQEEAYPIVPSGRTAWLAIGIPSAPRKGNPPYLQQTLESLLSELPDDATDPLYGRMRVIVMDTAPGRNHALTRLRGRLRSAKKGDAFAAKAAAYVDLLDNPGSMDDPTPDAPEPDDLHNPGDRPGRAVRQQTRDLISLLEAARHRATYYMFMEDDFRVCPFMLRALHYALAKAHAQQPQWLALRISYGMNGVILRARDLGSLMAHFRAGIARKPPDILWQEWAAGDHKPKEMAGRPLVVYRYNMMAHIGVVSSFAVRMARPAWPGCYVPMNRAWSLHLKERYNAGACDTLSDISPCNWPGAGGRAAAGEHRSWRDYQLSWPRAAAGPTPQGRPVGAQGLEHGHHAEREGGSSGGGWGGGDVFSAGAFANNFGRRPAVGSAARLGAEEGGDLGTAYALDDYDRP